MDLRFSIGLTPAIVALAATIACAHPKPGAHADVRIDISQNVVRCDVLMNVLFVDGLISVPRERRDDVTPTEEAAVFRGVREYYGCPADAGVSLVAQRPNSIRIDGIEVQPVIRSLSIVRPEPETRPGFVQNPALLIPRVHIVAEYQCASPPKQVSIVWGTYPRDFLANDRDVPPMASVEAVLTGHRQLHLLTFTQAEPEFIWHAPASNTDRLPPVPTVRLREAMPIPFLSIAFGLLSAAGAIRVACFPASRSGRSLVTTAAFSSVCLGIAAATWSVRFASLDRLAAQVPQADEAEAIFTPLHANIYRAFEYSSETDIYDALAASVDGPLLDTVYNDVYSALVMQEEGGALSRVRTLTPISTAVTSSGIDEHGTPRFGIDARWQVDGIVYHWGHSHERKSEHAASYVVAARPAGWRIVAVVPTEQRRIQSPAQAESAAAALGTPPARTDTSTGAVNRWHPQR